MIAEHMHGIERDQRIHRPPRVEWPARHVAEIDDLIDALRVDVGNYSFQREIISVHIGNRGKTQCHLEGRSKGTQPNLPRCCTACNQITCDEQKPARNSGTSGRLDCSVILPEAPMSNPRSTAQIAGHPVHPMLIPFPIACFVLTLLSDLAFWKTSNDFWADASLWLLGIGLIMAALAAVMGLIDVLGDVQIRNLSDAWLHAGGNVAAVVIELYNWYSRYEHGTAAIVPTGLTLSLVVVLILLFTGWKGWEMVYRDRVGVTDQRL
jgi:uncharacterized membrane protein